MGLLSRLLNPKTALRGLVDPAGATISAVKGTKGSSSWYDPAGLLGSSKKPSPQEAGMEMAPGVDPALYAGDQNDEAYGSFTDPFDVEAFYQYQDPGYAFELQQGQQALLNHASSGSGSRSGAALKDLLGYSQGFARTGYNDAFNRYQTQQGNIFGRLSSLAQLGQNAAAGVGAQGTNLAGNAGQMVSNAGAASGAGLVGAGNSLSSGLTNYWLMRQFGGPGQQAVATGGV
jgi:hypothetical protein